MIYLNFLKRSTVLLLLCVCFGFNKSIDNYNINTNSPGFLVTFKNNTNDLQKKIIRECFANNFLINYPERTGITYVKCSENREIWYVYDYPQDQQSDNLPPITDGFDNREDSVSDLSETPQRLRRYMPMHYAINRSINFRNTTSIPVLINSICLSNNILNIEYTAHCN
ncbi:exported hypothetical protein [Tenacibaculum sp. 190524A02b]